MFSRGKANFNFKEFFLFVQTKKYSNLYWLVTIIYYTPIIVFFSHSIVGKGVKLFLFLFGIHMMLSLLYLSFAPDKKKKSKKKRS